MSRPLFRLRSTLGIALGVSLVALNLAACSSSGSAKAGAAGSGSSSTQTTTSTAATASTASTAATSAASAAPAAPASGQGEPLAPIGCGGITPAMVNDLVTTPVTSVTFSSGFGVYPDHHFECDAGMQVDVYPQDSSKAQYTADLAAENVAPNPLPGVGDVAVYTLAPLAGMPDVYAHKGNVTCELKPSSTVFEVSMATRLPVVSIGVGSIGSFLPDGRVAVLHSSDVRVVVAGGAPLPNTSADVVRTAQLFAGLPYLWGGTSGFGFDCSGFTHLVFAMRGVTIPRDADAQARVGQAVARADLEPGDLVFFAANGVVHHVGIYLGNNTMLSSLQTGSPVEVSSLAAQPFASEYAGARRYVA